MRVKVRSGQRASVRPARRFTRLLIGLVAVLALVLGATAAARQVTDTAGDPASDPAAVESPGETTEPAPDAETPSVSPSDEPTTDDRGGKDGKPAKGDRKGQSSLARDAERAARSGGRTESPRNARTNSEPIGPVTSFRIATFNVLGDSHTVARGNKPGYRSGVSRMADVVSILNSQRLDVVGFQEFEPVQQAAFNRMAGGWDVYTSGGNSRRGVAWRTDVWTYEEGGAITIPYFRGQPTPAPWVKLRHNASGRAVYVMTLHNPTSNAKRGNNAGHRAEAVRREIAWADSIHSEGHPVFIVGDFNERAEAYCKVVGSGFMHAANGGSISPCGMPARAGIDWIFSSLNVEFSEYVRHQDAQVRRSSDHPFIIARGTITGPLADLVATPMVVRPGKSSSS